MFAVKNAVLKCRVLESCQLAAASADARTHNIPYIIIIYIYIYIFYIYT